MRQDAPAENVITVRLPFIASRSTRVRVPSARLDGAG